MATTGAAPPGPCKAWPVPDDRPPVDERVEVRIGKSPYAKFDKNDYSVPHTHVRRTLTVVATLEEVRILDGVDVVARHPRSFGKAARIENPEHIEELVNRHADLLFNRVSSRSQQNATIITTNRPFAEWGEAFQPMSRMSPGRCSERLR